LRDASQEVAEQIFKFLQLGTCNIILTGGASRPADACEKESRLAEVVGEPCGEAGGDGINLGTGFL